MKVVKKFVGVSSVCFALSSANAELVGEWKFPVGDVCKASVGNALEKFTRDGSPNFVESSDDGVLPGDGHVLAGQNNGFKCYHGLAQGSSYTVVMDVLFPVGAYGAWSYHALFQPLQGNNEDCRYFLVSVNDGGASFKVWYDSNKYYSSEYSKGVWYRFVITYDGSEKKKSFYIDGVPAGSAVSDPKMAVNGEIFYFLLDNNGEDKALDISYAAIYDSVLSADEIKADHSRPLAHDSDGSVIGQLYTWDLNESSSWSTLRGNNELSSNDTVCINVTKNDAMLTVDEDVNVAWIEFVNGSGAKLVVAEGKALSAKSIVGVGSVEVETGATVYVDSISGVNSILDNGTLSAKSIVGGGIVEVKEGATFYADGNVSAQYIFNNGTVIKRVDDDVSLPFYGASRGVYEVQKGTLKVSSVVKNVDNLGFVDDGKNENQLVVIKGGATFDLNGYRDCCVAVRLEEGAILKNTRAHIDYYSAQVKQLILAGNATVTASTKFGMLAPGYTETRIDLGENTLSVEGPWQFWLVNTTINGKGTVAVEEDGVLYVTQGDVNGEECTVRIGENGELAVGATMTVRNFINANAKSIWGNGTLKVTGLFTLGETKITSKMELGDGATIKVTGTTPQEVSSAFSASGTIKVDTSEITADKFASAENGLIPVLTIPKGSYKEAFKSWQISGKDASVRSLRWRQNGTDKMTLYVIRPGGIKIIVR